MVIFEMKATQSKARREIWSHLQQERSMDKSLTYTHGRMSIRCVEESDAGDRYLGWLNDEEVTRYLDVHSATKEGLVDFIRDMKRSDRDILFAIRVSGEFIGTSHLGPIDWKMNTAPIGLMIGNKGYWGKGCATEVFKLVLRYAFESLKLKEVTAGVDITHHRSIRALRKAGFE